jgi:hypothetical protein
MKSHIIAFGPMRQVGIVVRDTEKSMRHLVEVCGVGPWFYAEQQSLDEFRYKGRPYDLKVSIALANSRRLGDAPRQGWKNRRAR